MKLRKLQWCATMLALIGMLMPTAAWGTDAPRALSTGVDVALADGGLFVGQVVDAQGARIAQADVSIQYQGKEVVKTTTDENGVFAAKGMRGGQYDVVTADHVAPMRLWAADTAPPSARTAALIVTGENTVNGQNQGGVLSWMQAHPLIVAGVVVAAVATPIAIAASDNDDDSNS